MISETLLEGLPEEALIRSGFADLAAGRESIGSLLVLIGRPRLQALGFAEELAESVPEEPEKKLYGLLELQHGIEAHARYNALIRRLVSFERALEQRLLRAKRATD